MQTEIGNIKSVQQKQAQTLQNEEKHHHNIEDRIRNSFILGMRFLLRS
jgi:hypothetical protein